MKRTASEHLVHFFVLAVFLVPASDSFPLGRVSFSARHRREGGVETLREQRWWNEITWSRHTNITTERCALCAWVAFSFTMHILATHPCKHAMGSRNKVRSIGHVKSKTSTEDYTPYSRYGSSNIYKLNVRHSELKARPFLFHLVLRSILRSGYT